MNKNIAIDGPAGAGKSTIAKGVAKKLGLVYVDTGAMYRAIGLYLFENGISEKDFSAVSEALPYIHIELEYLGGEQQLILNGKNINSQLRTPEVGRIASKFATIPAVRRKLVDIQKEFSKKTSVVMDGRDIGTHVLPDASVKIYLTAEVTVRAKRRYDELVEKGKKVELSFIEEDIRKRDENDMNREVSPLRQAEDAILLDSSYLSINEVIERIIEIAISKNSDFKGGVVS